MIMSNQIFNNRKNSSIIWGVFLFSFRIYIVCLDITFASKQHKQILFL
jgi:hypothetical protein